MSLSNLHLLEQAAIIQPTMATSSAPSLHSPAAMASVDKPGPFLRAPREVRDQIYRYLLSTKHTKDCYEEPGMDTLRYRYTYRFHTAILFTNRQVYSETSNIFYMENLFIRVNSVVPGPIFQPDDFGGYEDNLGRCYELPILSKGSKAQACTRHVMEIDLIPEIQLYGHHRNNHFILACDDLPSFCRALLLMDGQCRKETEVLLGMELWIIIGDEAGITGEEPVVPDTSTDGRTTGILTAATKNAAANRESPIKNPRTIAERNATIYEDTNGNGSTTANGSTKAKSRLSEQPSAVNGPRVRRLLEPFRALYSIGFSYIDAPIGEGYQHEIHTSLSRARPSIDDLFQEVPPAYEEAIKTFGTNDFALAIQKMRGAFDISSDFWGQIRSPAFTKVATGPFAGFSFGGAIIEIQYTLSKNLARANLKFHNDVHHVRTAQAWARRIIELYTSNDAWDRVGHENAMAYYLEAEVWETLDQLGEHNGRPRSEALQDVVNMLTEALRREPRNAMLEKEMLRRQKEKTTAEVMEEVMEMERREGEVQSMERTG